MNPVWVKEFIELIQNNNIDAAYNLRFSHLPKLYKFEKVEDCRLDTLKNGDIYISKKEYFNDIYDSDGTFISQQINIDSSHKNDVLQILREFTSHAKISCFTEELYNFPMWWNYADQYRGFCAEYDFTSLHSKGAYDFISCLYPVNYSASRYKVDKIVEHIYSSMLSDNFKIDSSCYLFTYLSFCTKHSSWMYEKEWRFIDFLNESENYRDYYPLPLKPSKIYIGINMPPDDVLKLKQIASDMNCPIFQMQYPKTTQQLFTFDEIFI